MVASSLATFSLALLLSSQRRHHVFVALTYKGVPLLLAFYYHTLSWLGFQRLSTLEIKFDYIKTFASGL